MAKACAPKGRISYKQRERLPAQAFALPSVKMFPLYKKGPGGTLLPSRNHAINAKGRAQQAYNRGELSKSTLAMIDRQADRVIKECQMAKSKKKSKKRSFNPKTGRAMKPGQKRTGQSRSALTSREINMLRSVDRGAKAGSPRKSSNYSSDSAKNLLRSLSRRKLITQIAPGKGYMVTSAGAKAIGNVYVGKAELKAKLSKKGSTRSKTAKTKKVAKRTAKKTAKKVAKRTAKKVAKRVAKKTAKKVAKKTAKSVAKKAKRKPAKRRTVKARYKKGVRVKVDGSRTRVPVEVRDVKSVKNKVIVLV